MPAKSRKQQMAAGAALSAKRGERPKSSLRGASKQMADSMSERELHDMASVKRKRLPKRAGAKSGGRASSSRSRSASARSSAKSRTAAKKGSRGSARKGGGSKRGARSSSR